MNKQKEIGRVEVFGFKGRRLATFKRAEGRTTSKVFVKAAEKEGSMPEIRRFLSTIEASLDEMGTYTGTIAIPVNVKAKVITRKE